MRLASLVLVLAISIASAACFKKSEEPQPQVAVPKAAPAEPAPAAPAAPSMTKDQVYSALAKKACDCIAKVDTNLPKEQRDTAMGICILAGYNENETYQKVLDLDLANEKAMEGLGTAVGVKMATHCPDVLTKMN
jgi:hypothetical protein